MTAVIPAPFLEEFKVKKTKTDSIRDHLLSLPPSLRAPTAVMKTLRSKGVKVTRNHVSVVKSAISRKVARGTEKDLLLAKKFLSRVGSTAEARRLITLVGRIMS